MRQVDKQYYEVSTINEPSWMFQLSEYVWTLRSSVWVAFNNFLLIDATDK